MRQGLFQSEIVERIRTDPGLSEPVRTKALELAASPVEGPNSLDRASRAVAERAGASDLAYRRALQQAERACRLNPYRPAYRVTLGMAQYRVGKYAEAFDTLTRTDPAGSARDATSEPPRLALLAMSEYRLGRKDRAAATLERFRAVLRQTNRSADAGASSLRREAEQLIEPASAPPSSAAHTGN